MILHPLQLVGFQLSLVALQSTGRASLLTGEGDRLVSLVGNMEPEALHWAVGYGCVAWSGHKSWVSNEEA